MKSLIRRGIGIIAISTAVYSCASIGRLEGGPIDETPPRFVGSNPMPGAFNNNKKRIAIEFDEYIKLEKPMEKVVISPPQIQQPEIRANGKKVIVNLQDTLKANTTYTIDFADAIVDNNEGNPLPDFGFTFSTGDRLDSMVVSGIVLNAANLEPVKGMLVGLHEDLADSAFNTKPFDRVGRTDSRGRFTIRGIAPGNYNIYALQDADQNFMYNQPTEIIAFQDSLLTPVMEIRLRQDTIWKDSLTVDTVIEKKYTHYLPDDVLLRCFKEVTHSQRLLKSERLDPWKFSLYFTAPADSLPLLKGLNFDEEDAFVVEQLTGRNDTIHYWVKDSLIYKMDTLQMSLTYLYTDTLAQLVPRTDTLKLATRNKPKVDKNKDKKKKKDDNESEENDATLFLSADVYAPGSMDVYDYITLSFKEPIASIEEEFLHLRQKVDTLWQDMSFDLVYDSLDVKRFHIFADWEPEESYMFEVDSTAIHGLHGLFTDKIKKEFKVKRLEDYGQIFFNLSGVEGSAFVELLDGQDRVVRTVPVVDGKADFYFLNPSKYCARLVEDTNENGIWDTGNYKERIQPERVYYYFQVLDLKANFDLTQDWDILNQSLDKQKPEELKKQKPDEDKKKRNQSNANTRR